MEKRNVSTLFWGGIVILVGVLFLLFNLEILPAVWKPVILSWQALLILLGIKGLFRKNYFFGIILAVIGIIFILPKLSIVAGFAYSSAMMNGIVWPIVIIGVGLLIVLNRTHSHVSTDMHFDGHTQKTMINDGAIDYNLIMNGADAIYLGSEFKGGKINTIMGGLKLDLRKTKLPVGNTVLKLSAIMGGVTLVIPSEWPIEIHSSAILGGFTDKRAFNGSYTDRKLIIEADVLMGGGTIAEDALNA